MLAELPTRVGDFELGPRVGSGAMAVVVRARHLPTGQDVAVKLFERRLLDRTHHSARFLAEARAMAHIRHPRIARVHDVGRDGAWYWYAMDYLPGGSLSEHVREVGALPPGRALALVDEVLEGLQAVHSHALVHRDVKPSNVMRDEAGGAVLVDFGLARHPDGSVPFRTMADVGMGSPGFTAPEQRIDAKSVDHRADVFSTGALLVYLLTARRPDGLVHRPIARPDDVFDGVPADLRPLVERATAFAAADRHPTAGALRQEVQSALRRHGPGWWGKLVGLFGG